MRNTWSAMSVTYSLNPFYSAGSCTLPKVSPIIAMSIFMNTTRIMNEHKMNIDMPEVALYPV